MVVPGSATTPRHGWVPPGAAIAVVAAALFAGCGGGGGGGGGGQSPSTTPAPSPQSGLAAHGRALADARCRTCHSVDGTTGVGPTWKGLAGSQVELVGGKTVTADDAYLRTAIERPDDQVVSGYQSGVMSSAIPPGSISGADARALIAYIKTLR